MTTPCRPTAKYLSARFTQADFADMRQDTMYAFYSAPDSGKTTMIINVLQPYLKRIGKKALYLSHRKIINDQNEAMFDETVIHSQTYQKLETDIIHEVPFFTDYDFIICDECHYFVEDSAMNNLTDESFNFVNNSKAVVLLMTGTPDYLKAIKGLWRRPIMPLVEIDRQDHNIEKVCLCSASKAEEAFLKAELDRLVSMKKRIIVYDSNISELYQLCAEYQHKADELGVKVSFICSRRNQEYSKHSDNEALETLIDSKHIDTDLLFITSALNTGVSIDEDFEYLFIFGNPSKTDIFQLIARIRRGNTNRRIKTVYCSVPKRCSILCRLEGLELDLSYRDNPIEWQKQRKSRSIPDYMQVRHNYMKDRKGNQLFTPKDNPKTKAHLQVNQMKLAKVQQDISEYRSLIQIGSMPNAYRLMFDKRYANITITTLKDELELRGVRHIVSLLNRHAHLEYLGVDERETIKTTCLDHGLQTSIGKINELLNKHSFRIRLVSKQKKTNGQKIQPWYIERY
jgi:hypothetical protein